MRKLFYLFLCAWLVFLGCNARVLRVTKFTPSEEFGQFQSFTITFNKEIGPKDKMDNWISADYMKFSPAIQGKYKWKDAKTLVFSPSGPLTSGQNYTATFNKDALLKNATEPDMKARFNTISFKAPDFAVLNAQIFWSPIPKSDYKLEVKANIDFNYPVAPDELRKHLKVMADDKEVTTYTIESESPAKTLAISFGEVGQKNKEQNFKIFIKKGLVSTAKKEALKDNKEFAINLPAITEVAIENVEATMDEDGYTIAISTTQEIDADEADKFIKVTPALENQEMSSDGNVLYIKGGMKPDGEVKLEVNKGLPGLYGGVLKDNYKDYLTAKDVEPLMRFSDQKGMYLVRGGLENLKIETVNIEEVEVEVLEVFHNNMLFFFDNNYSYDRMRYSTDDEYVSETADYNVDNYGKSIYSESIKFSGAKNAFQYATINLNKALNQRFKGIYVVRITSDKDYWVRDAKIISFSDIGLIAKYSENDLLVFANSLSTAQSLAGVTVSLISKNNQTLMTAVTDAQGVAKFENVSNQVKDFEPRLIAADLGDDFNFLDLQTTQIETSRFDAGGKSVTSNFYDTYLYAERNLFRPGETANVSGIVRDNLLGIVKNIPIKIKVYAPTGKIFEQYQKTLNDQGSFEQAISFPEFAQTGQYRVQAYTGDDRLLKSYTLNVEEFTPDKIKVVLDAPEKVAKSENAVVKVKADYLFGEPARSHNYESNIVFDHSTFASKAFPKFNFSQSNFINDNIETYHVNGILKDDGTQEVRYSVPSDISSGGVIIAKAYVSVFDATGRTVNRMESFRIYPKDYFIGIKKNGYYFGANQEVGMQMIAVSPEDKPIEMESEVSVVRFEWQTVLRKNDEGVFRYQSEMKEIPVTTQSLKIGKTPTNFSFRPEKSGRYQVRIARKSEGENAKYVYEDVYVYGYKDASASSFEINKEGIIDIVPDKEKYQPGDQAKILFITPFTGKMLVTIERESVVKYLYVDVTKNSTEITLPIEEKYLPNMYISATLFKPHKLSTQDVPFLVGHGWKSISVEKASTILPVTIQAPERIKPRTKQVITIKSLPKEDIFVTLAAVDEGILQVKRFETPDPHSYMYGKRQLSVESYNLYEMLLPEYEKIASSAAGGDDYASGKFQNPIKTKRYKLVSFWSGIKKTNANGEVKIELDIPQYNGELRLMAVAYQGANFGSGSKPMKVSDDVVAIPGIPRAITMGDSLSVPVNISNLTEKEGEVNVTIETEGPLSVTSAKTQTLKLAAKGAANVYFGLKTKAEVGAAKITIRTSGIGTTVEETEVPVRPASSFINESGEGEISAGQSLPVAIPNDYVMGTQQTQLTVSNFPQLKYAENLRYLIGYPFGCAEQITSKLFPQIYFPELAQVAAPDLMGKGGSAEYFVKTGIHKLETMFEYNQGFRYWAGGSNYNDWVTVYATHFLVEAQKAGYEVNNLPSYISQIKKIAQEKEVVPYHYRSSQGTTITQIAPKSTIYALYVMALNGQADIPLMNYYRARPELLRPDTKYLLAGAFALAKNWAAYNELMPQGFEPEFPERDMDNSFDSEIRANAMMLNVLLDVEPNSSKIRTLTEYLAKQSGSTYSTQDNAWLFLALGKAAGKKANSNVSIEVMVDGKTVRTLSKSNESLDINQWVGKNITLKASGSGTTYYFWNTSGTKKSAMQKEEDKDLSVRRTYYNRNGEEVKNNQFKLGDLVVCKVTISTGERGAKYVAVSDLIPSGFEIENPRLTSSTELKWVAKAGGSFSPDFLDYRDDRILIFENDLNAKNTQTFYYMMRAVNTGDFVLPPIAGEAMYNPNVRSINGGKWIRIRA